MFNIGDILKARMDVAETQYGGFKETNRPVYNKMMELAFTKRFEVVGKSPVEYQILHVGENVQNAHPLNEVHENMVLANDEEES